MHIARSLLIVLAGAAPLSAQAPKPLFLSKVISESTPGHAVEIDVDIRGLKRLFLEVQDGGDGYSCDWADWAEPRLVGPQGELRLSTVKWKAASTGWGRVNVDRNANGGAMKIAGEPVVYGIGVHANSLLVFDLPKGYERFRARGGLDNGGTDQGGATTVRFAVYSKRPQRRGPKPLPQITETAVPVDMFTLPDDLAITVWAHSPLFFNPTNIDIDAKGRIWVAEGMNYRGSRKRPAGDRIVVVEDRDGDGVADDSHVFVQDENLISPLGVAVVGKQVIVAQPPDLLVYTDVDGDARFDPETDRFVKLLSGFYGRNHDHSLHSVTVGPDGWWYFNHGNTGSTVTDRSGKTFRIGSHYSNRGESGKASDDGHVYVGGAAFRMKPDGTELQVIGHNFRNSYEQTVSSFGDVFQNDNDDPPNCRTSWLMEYGNAGYASNDGLRNWRADMRPGQSSQIAHWRQQDPGSMPAGDVYGGGAPTGIVFYENGALGERYSGLLLSCESAKNVVFGYYPRRIGAGFALERFNFLTSNVEEEFAGADFRGGRGGLKTLFRPSDVAVGPDGAIYVADWFDPRVGGHATHDSGGSGTIYRIAPKGAKLSVPQLDLATLDGQIAALRNPAVNVRALGLEALAARGAAAVPAVRALLGDDDRFVRARAVFALARLGDAGLAEVERLLAHDDAQVRIAAFRALRRRGHRVLAHAKELAVDPSPGVRREVALALRDVPFTDCRDALVAIAQRYDGYDRWYLEAFGVGCSGKEAAMYATLAEQLAPDVLRWSEAFARIAWRLHPPEAIANFRTRALAPGLDAATRTLAIDSLAFIADRAAGEAMIEIAMTGPKDTFDYATWWVRHRHNNDWRAFDLVARLPEAPAAPAIVTTAISPASAGAKLPEVHEILELDGDAARGKTLFSGRGTCFACHQVRGVGGTIGPDLTDVAQKLRPEVLLRAMIEPSAEIALGFDATQITKKDKSIVLGYVLGEGDPLLIRDMAGIQHAIDANDVHSREKLTTSLMPAAGAIGLRAQDLADLVAYLASLR